MSSQFNAALEKQYLGQLNVTAAYPPETLEQATQYRLAKARVEVARLEELVQALKDNPGVERVISLMQGYGGVEAGGRY